MIRVGHLSPLIIQEEDVRAFYKVAPPDFKLVSRALNISQLTDEEITDKMKGALVPLKDLIEYGVDIIVIGGSPTVLTAGEEFVNFLKDYVEGLGVKVGFSHYFQMGALEAVGMKNPVVFTPWGNEVGSSQNQRMADDLEQRGIKPRRIFGLNIPLKERGRLPDDYLLGVIPTKLKELAEDFDGIYIPCANWPVVDCLGELEKIYGKPAVSSSAALMHGIIKTLGLKTVIKGFGRLLEHN